MTGNFNSIYKYGCNFLAFVLQPTSSLTLRSIYKSAFKNRYSYSPSTFSYVKVPVSVDDIIYEASFTVVWQSKFAINNFQQAYNKTIHLSPNLNLFVKMTGLEKNKSKYLLDRKKKFRGSTGNSEGFSIDISK